MAYDYASDPFYQDYQRQMRRVRNARPSKNAPLRLDVPNRKFSDEQIRRAMDVRNAPARPDTGATAERPRTFAVEWAANKLRDLGLLSPEAVDSAVRFDNEWTGLDSSNQSFQNIIGSSAAAGDPTVGDYANVLLNAPVIGGLAVKPVEMLAAKLGRGALNLGRRALATRAGRYMTEARPLLDNADDAIETAFTVTPGAQRRITNQRPVVQGLPAPEQRLGLPAPGPGLPDFAAKPRGGQWWTDESPYGLLSPAVSSKENIYLGARFSSDPTDKALADWWDKALPRYIQNDFATPNDPLRVLADQGYIQDVENAAQWSNRIKSDIVPMPLQKLLFDPKTAETGVRDKALAAMPWVSKMPATDTIYGFWPREATVGALSHIRDEMVNALKPDTSGIPADLAVRPESLGRMSFAQAAERVGLINQWRAKQAEQAALSALDSPAIHTFKEYPDNNPMGLRWVELKTPAEISSLPPNWRVEKDGDGFSVWDPADPEWPVASGQTEAEAIANANDYTKGGFLQQALKYEGDTMGHCVGGYCDDVMSGRSRIFSLRDAKGEPHVTIETGRRDVPRFNWDGLRHRLDEDAQDAAYDAAMTALRERGDDALFDYEGNLTPFGQSQLNHEQDIFAAKWLMNNGPEGIIQIKGKQNRAPKDDYLPFVQDFVKSGQWIDVGDLANTGLVKLPDGRYITAQQAEEAIAAIPETTTMQRAYGSREMVPTRRVYDPSNLDRLDPEEWSGIAPYFEGYARGGRALAAKPCSCDHSFSVR